MGPISPGRGLGGLPRAWPRPRSAGDHSVASSDGRAAARGPRGRPRLHHHRTIEAGDAAPEDPDPGRSGGAGDHRDAGHRHRLRCHAASRGGQGLYRHRFPARDAENCQHGERAARRVVRAWRGKRSRRARLARHRVGERVARLRDAARLGEGRGDRKLNGALQRAFAADGPLAARVAGFKLRPQQLEMAAAIHAAIERTGVLVAEAGTGTGKTFAYLVPARLAGGKVIVSTGAETLQDQLYDRDLPAVREALACGTTAALLKGRANYVCLYRMKRAASEGRLASREEVSQLHRIERFAAMTTTGDRADLADVPEDAPVWAHATSTRDNCLGQEGPDYRDCFVMRARRNEIGRAHV